MWKKEKSAGKMANKQSFSIVHRYIQHFNEVSGNKSASIRRRSKISGVMITQYLIKVPEGKSSPDFLCKPTAVTVKEGELAVFKAVVLGNPKPEVSWKRNVGSILKEERIQSKYEASSGEHLLEIHSVRPADADVYKCYIANDYGKAFCSTTLNVIEGSINPADFRKLLKKSSAETADGESGDIFWETMLNADKKDYKHICSEFGVTDFELTLKRLGEKKKLRENNKSLNDEIPDDEMAEVKYDHKGRNKALQQDGTGLFQDGSRLSGDGQRTDWTDVEEAEKLHEFIVSKVDFVIKIQEITATEGGDALFECVLTHPLPKITWTCKGKTLEGLDKHSVSVSDHKLIHRLLIKGCTQLDVGIYSAVAGAASSSAWLLVEDESAHEPGGKRVPRRTTVAAAAARIDLEKVAREQQLKNREEIEKILASVKAKHRVVQGREEYALTTNGADGEAARVRRSGRIGSQRNGEGDERSAASVGDGKRKKHQKSLQTHLDISKDCGAEYYDDAESQTEGPDLHQKESSTILKNSGKRKKKSKKVHWKENTGKGELMDQDEQSCSNDGDSHGQVKNQGRAKSNKKPKTGVRETGKMVSDGERNNSNEEEEESEEEDEETEEEDEEGEDDEEEEQDDEEEQNSAGRIKHQRNPKSTQKMKKAVHEIKRIASEDEEPYSDEEEDPAGHLRHRSRSESNNTLKIEDDEMNELTSDDDDDSYSDEEEDEEEDTPEHIKCQIPTKSRRKLKITEIDELANDEPETCRDEEDTPYVSNQSRSKSKTKKKTVCDEMDERMCEEGDGYSDKEEEAADRIEHRSHSQSRKKPKLACRGDSVIPSESSACDHPVELTKSHRSKRRKRKSPLTEDAIIDPGVHFICGLSDVDAIIDESAELTCKLSSRDCDGVWFRDGKQITPDDNFSIIQDGSVHKLIITKCSDEHSGKYRFEADGRKTEARVNVKDPPRINLEDLDALSQPSVIKTGHNAILKVYFVGYKPIKVQWYREGEELHDDANLKIERSANHSRLLMSRCQRKDTGQIKVKLKNEHGFTEAFSSLVVLDKPTPPLGPAEVTESSATCIEFKWRPPKDDGGCPVMNYTIERQQVGRNTWKKLGEIPGVPSYRDVDVDHGRKYCYRIRAVTTEGTSDLMETDDIQAGTLAFPGAPAPPKVASAFDDCINISWTAPGNKGGSRILGYILEKRKKGSNLWNVVNGLDELIKEKKYAVKDVVAGMEYEFRVTAVNLSGPGEFSNPSEFVFARDPKKPPGRVTGLKLTETSYTHMVLTWTKPEDKPGIQDEAKGYFVEIRRGDCLDWCRCNITPIIVTSFSVKSLKSMELYWVRVIATNDGGESSPEELPNYVLAMPSPVRPKFTSKKMKSFMVVRAGNSVRITVNFKASPLPHILWLKDNVPVAKRVTISNSDESSQLLIPSSERSDSGIYSVLVKNLVGQETFTTEVRVTDDPKPPGPVELIQNVPGTMTVTWQPSPDEKRDDRLYYIVSKLDSTKSTWATVAERLFNNKFTVCNIMHGREYQFRVYAKNDMGMSAPSESPPWGVEKKKAKFAVNVPTIKDCDMQCPPTFIVPLKLHASPKGYECYMSCAVKGNPTPRITWYRNNISINTNTNYYISNTCGVCSMLILHVGLKDTGEYTITAENSLGRAESTTVLSVTE